MDEEFKKEPFVTLKLKKSVVVEFRKFCIKQKLSQSMTLKDMLYFFERNQLSPTDDIPDHLVKVERKILKRINAVIAIMKDVEKTQTLPTVGMLQALFSTTEKADETPLFQEKNQIQRTLKEELKLWEKSNS